MLIQAGSRISPPNRDFRNTPLHISAGHGFLDCCRCLLRHGADINATNLDGDTPRHVALFFLTEEDREANAEYFESLLVRMDALLGMDLELMLTLLSTKLLTHSPQRISKSLLRMLPKELVIYVIHVAGLKTYV